VSAGASLPNRPSRSTTASARASKFSNTPALQGHPEVGCCQPRARQSYERTRQQTQEAAVGARSKGAPAAKAALAAGAAVAAARAACRACTAK
jgi:hypothetical protein